MSTGLPGFDGKTDVAIGSVFGIRSWSIASDGLRGSASGLWVSGENIASCSNVSSTCEPPVEECGCGFWAYWKDSATIFPCFDVTGVVEGYGRTLIGPKGFRSEKARIVALSIVHSVSVEQMITVQGYDAPLYSTVQSMLSAHPLTEEYYEKDNPQDYSNGGLLPPGPSVTSTDSSAWISVNGGTWLPTTSITYTHPNSTYIYGSGGGGGGHGGGVTYWPLSGTSGVGNGGGGNYYSGNVGGNYTGG